MTKEDVLEQFGAACDAIKKAELPFDEETLGGIALQLTDRLLQANEIEENERRVSPVIAGQGMERNLRGLN